MRDSQRLLFTKQMIASGWCVNYFFEILHEKIDSRHCGFVIGAVWLRRKKRGSRQDRKRRRARRQSGGGKDLQSLSRCKRWRLGAGNPASGSAARALPS